MQTSNIILAVLATGIAVLNANGGHPSKAIASFFGRHTKRPASRNTRVR